MGTTPGLNQAIQPSLTGGEPGTSGVTPAQQIRQAGSPDPVLQPTFQAEGDDIASSSTEDPEG